VSFHPEANQPQQQQQQQAGWVSLPPPTRPGHVLKWEVAKPEGLIGHLHMGPMSVHQRVVVGRAPGSDILLEHLSISR
jgi:hypothetical protein